jgi:hypothetical protein
LAMWAAGGERAEDLDQFRQDKALALLTARCSRLATRS